MTSIALRTGADGTLNRLVKATASALVMELVHAVTSASVSAMLAARSMWVLNRGSSFRSSRPIAVSRFCQWVSVTTWTAIQPSVVGKALYGALFRPAWRLPARGGTWPVRKWYSKLEARVG